MGEPLMCGIIGRFGADGVDAVDDVLHGLKNLEYRGYDSAGIAVQGPNGIDIHKQSGTIDRLAAELDERPPEPRSHLAIGHTRWSTHGRPTDENAHPHTGCHGRVAVVHNGIIDNHETLRAELTAAGHEFDSETDTEVVAHLVEEYLPGAATPRDAFTRAVERLEGSYAIALLVDGVDALFATRAGSPLVLGVGETGCFLASDVPAFLDHTDRVIYLEDGDMTVVTADGYAITTLDGEPVDRPVETVEWNPEDTQKGTHDHFMSKEIFEQPTSLSQALQGRVDPATQRVTLERFDPGAFADVSAVHLIGCGTSYHAALYGAILLQQHGVPAQAFLASEYSAVTDSDAPLVIGVTQSGETADTLGALRTAQEAGLRTLALTNVVGSTAARECDDVLYIRAGPEIGVAATKTFASQVATLVLLTARIASDVGATPVDPDCLRAITSLPDVVEEVLTTSNAFDLATRFHTADAHFFIGRGVAYPVALEGALKLKEISYEHAEGFPAGELKHGPLALVTESTPVLAVFTGHEDERLLANVREVQARGAPVIGLLSESSTTVAGVVDEALTFPDTHPLLAPVLATVQLQLLSYHIANLLNRPIDKPRNLAKSVTVE